MGDETISSDTKSDAQALAELELEFERELKRNALALQLLRERAEEAKIAKSRAELSAQKKECMMNKLKNLQENMALTTDTLTKAQERIEKQEQIRAMVNNMQVKIKNYEVKLNMQKQNSQQLGMQNSQQLGILGECNPGFDFPTPLIDYEEEEEKERQAKQTQETEIEPEAQKLPSDGAQKVQEESQQIQTTLSYGDLSAISDNSNKKQTPSKLTKIDYAQTVLDLQEKLSRATAVRETETTQSQLPTKNLVKFQQEDSNPTASISSDSSSWQCKSDQENPDHETECPHSDLNESVQRLEAKCVGARSEESLNIDLQESVQRLEAKCGGIREELGQMALSEQYMRTKQAQLRAKKKELEAKEATIKAELREKEASDMRTKVEGMMKLLAERKNKLKVTENVIVKKGNVVDSVNKIIKQKDIRIKQREKQKDELLAFGKKPPK